MFGKKSVVEIGKWNNLDEDTPQGFRRCRDGAPEAWVDVGSAENAAKLFDLTPEQVAAIREYGYIDIDVEGAIGAVTLEAGYGF